MRQITMRGEPGTLSRGGLPHRSAAWSIAMIAVMMSFTPAGAAVGQEPADRPNIVLIFIDDLGYADLGCFGADDLRTPHIDKLAAEGMKLTSYYATPVCSMSRASLMTGCYNVRVSIPGVLFPKDRIGLHPDELTVAEVLKSRGYATCAIGKWHLGHLPPHLPTSHGFDRYFGIPYSNDMGQGNRGRGFPPLPLIRDLKTIETEPDQSQLTKRYTEEAIRFITEHKDGPFFLYLPHTMVHLPLYASEDFKGKSKRGIYGDAVEEIDWSVGQITDTLAELGIADHTLVMFTSDNGPGPKDASAGVLRGRKGSTWEGGVREPTVIRWPARVKPGTVCDRIVGNIDVLPTFAAITGATLPADRVIDGRDFSPLLADPAGPPTRTVHLYYPGRGQKPDAIRVDQYKLREVGKTVELYNLAEDISESDNLAAKMPDKVAELRKELETRAAEVLAHQRPAGKFEGK